MGIPVECRDDADVIALTAEIQALVDRANEDLLLLGFFDGQYYKGLFQDGPNLNGCVDNVDPTLTTFWAGTDYCTA